MIYVVNKYKHLSTNNDIYVGRGSPLGNPYTHIRNNTKAEYVVSSRNVAIAIYENWLSQKIKDKDPDVCNMLNKIYSMAKRGDVNLVCYCFPKNCHANIIKRIVESKL